MIDNYSLTAGKIKVNIEIKKGERDFVPVYYVKLPKLEEGTLALLDEIKEEIISELQIKTHELLDPRAMEDLKAKLYSQGVGLIRKKLPGISTAEEGFLVTSLVNDMLGLGKIELLLADGKLEEIVVNSSKDTVWVYHKQHGWLKTDITIPNEADILNYASAIGRKVGRQITTMHPLLDAHLVSGDRVNATLFPISTVGNTLTIRMFRRKPWTITDFIENKTISSQIAALLWLAIEFEMNMIISGGTATGKTSFLNTLMPFIPPNQRIISIEDTREVNLPDFLHWIPMTTREPNPEGKGGINMLDLLVNSLRMRPDRMVVGEIRRSEEAEVLFEAMHTGHSVYSTLHADTAGQTLRRLINPPISVPEPLLEALDLLVVMFRDRRKGIRRIYEVVELIPSVIATGEERVKENMRVLFKWEPVKDEIIKYKESIRVMEKLKRYGGMNETEIQKDLREKQLILDWMVNNKVNTVNAVGFVVSEYYQDPEKFLKTMRKKPKAADLIPKHYLESL